MFAEPLQRSQRKIPLLAENQRGIFSNESSASRTFAQNPHARNLPERPKWPILAKVTSIPLCSRTEKHVPAYLDSVEFEHRNLELLTVIES